jgi:hypothetical protein
MYKRVWQLVSQTVRRWHSSLFLLYGPRRTTVSVRIGETVVTISLSGVSWPDDVQQELLLASLQPLFHRLRRLR